MNIPHGSESYRRLNPSFFGMGQFQPAITEQKTERPLVGKSPRRKTGEIGLVRSGPKFRVTLTNYRRREIDDDNLRGGFKHLRDSIAGYLGLDDSQKFIEWQYGCQITRGREGTAVLIEAI